MRTIKIFKRFLIICLCSIIVFNTAYKPIRSEAAELGIISGSLASLGVSLSFPQIALLVSAAGGCVYSYENRNVLGSSLEAYLYEVAENFENGVEKVRDWIERAKLGYIMIKEAQPFIEDALKDWIVGLKDGSTRPLVSGSGADFYGRPLFYNGQIIPPNTRISFGIGSNNYFRSNTECQIFRFYVHRLNDDGTNYFQLYTYMVDTNYSNSINYFIGESTNYSMSTDRMYDPGSRAYFYNLVTYNNLNNENDLIIINKLLQGARKVDRVDTFKIINKMLQGGYEYESNNPIVNSLSPEVFTGGISNVIDSGNDMSNVTIPDIVIDGTGSIAADTTKTGEDVFAGSITDTMAALSTGTMTWSDYIADVGVAAPTITLPDAADDTKTNDYLITDTGISDVVVDNAATVSPDLDKYKVQLRDFFPFCLPFDMVDFITVLAAEPETPVFDLKFPSINGESLDLKVDLSAWDGVAQIMRNLELLALIIGLCFKTREMIRG